MLGCSLEHPFFDRPIGETYTNVTNYPHPSCNFSGFCAHTSSDAHWEDVRVLGWRFSIFEYFGKLGKVSNWGFFYSISGLDPCWWSAICQRSTPPPEPQPAAGGVPVPQIPLRHRHERLQLGLRLELPRQHRSGEPAEAPPSEVPYPGPQHGMLLVPPP